VKFDSIRLRDFRNYRDLTLEIPSGVCVFTGSNGQGKTNLMEAFHVLLRGESFRPVTPESLLLQDAAMTAPAAVVEARLTRSGLRHAIKITFARGRKLITWNEQRATAGQLARHFPVVLFSPESLAAIKNGPDERRRLLDEVILTHAPGRQKVLSDFRRALKVRNRVLRDASIERTPRAEAEALLESLDASYLPLATELTVARLAALRDLSADFTRAASAVLELPDVDISVDYEISSRIVTSWTRAEILSEMHARALELRAAELRAGTSLVGPHKHDVRILFAQKDSRFFCSQGQQRALILSFKMAQILYHHRAYELYPFLLLDDVLSELDPVRRTNLVEFLRDIPAQIFLTTTDLSFTRDFGDRPLNVFGIEGGKVAAL
jgi:DNA replication and repair protein RecF